MTLYDEVKKIGGSPSALKELKDKKIFTLKDAFDKNVYAEYIIWYLERKVTTFGWPTKEEVIELWYEGRYYFESPDNEPYLRYVHSFIFTNYPDLLKE